jgi:mycothiol synthase
MPEPQLEMELDCLDSLPEVALPPGYRLRTYQEGDAAAWCQLMAAGIGGEHREEAFLGSVSGPRGFDPEGLFFLEKDGQTVGSACAVWREGYAEDTGYVHMVAVDPRHQGRGLGRALTVAVLYRFRELGMRRAVLQTDDFRLPAIRLYLGLGFRPRLTHEGHQVRWREVYHKLGRQEEPER